MDVDKIKINGVVYTPEWIVNLILDNINYKNNIHNKKIIDPACGDGAFLKIVIKRFINDCINYNLPSSAIVSLLEENIYGFDIDSDSVALCKHNLNEISAPYHLYNINWNVKCMDTLDKDHISKYYNLFDYVVGNPPYVKIQNLGENRRINLQKEWLLCKSGATDTYIAFFEIGFNLIKDNGLLGYITPNTYFKTKAGKGLREFIINNKCLNTIINFGDYQVFPKATTYSAITILHKDIRKTFSLHKWTNDQVTFVDDILLNDLFVDNWTLESSAVLSQIRKIESRGKPLGQIAKIHTGITTLADDLYIFDNIIFNNNLAKITIKNGQSYLIEKEILKPIIKASTLKRSEDIQNRYVIFPYKKNVNGKHIVIPEEELKSDYPLTYSYFVSVKDRLDFRDKGKPNSVAWYAFGRNQGLDTSFGEKILTSLMNVSPNFIVWEKKEYTFYGGYCVKYEGDLAKLASQLNTPEMDFYIKRTSKDYQHGYKSYSKSFIERFGVENID